MSIRVSATIGDPYTSITGKAADFTRCKQAPEPAEVLK